MKTAANHKPLTIAVTGMNARADNPGPGVAVARCLREVAGFEGRIIGLGYDVLDPGLFQTELTDAAYL
jgi:carbamoyl-phosphate synthase large subunit